MESKQRKRYTVKSVNGAIANAQDFVATRKETRDIDKSGGLKKPQKVWGGPLYPSPEEP